MQIFFTFIFHFPLPPPIIATSRRPTTLLLTPQPHFSSTTNQTPPQPPTKLLFNHQPNFSPTTNQTPPQPPTTLLFNHQPHFSSTTNYTPPLAATFSLSSRQRFVSIPPTLCRCFYRITTVSLPCYYYVSNSLPVILILFNATLVPSYYASLLCTLAVPSQFPHSSLTAPLYPRLSMSAQTPYQKVFIYSEDFHIYRAPKYKKSITQK